MIFIDFQGFWTLGILIWTPFGSFLQLVFFIFSSKSGPKRGSRPISIPPRVGDNVNFRLDLDKIFDPTQLDSAQETFLITLTPVQKTWLLSGVIHVHCTHRTSTQLDSTPLDSIRSHSSTQLVSAQLVSAQLFTRPLFDEKIKNTSCENDPNESKFGIPKVQNP